MSRNNGDHRNPNRQRDHQANERTFLAWLRTAIALIGFGFAIARFGLFTHQLQATLTTQPLPEHSGLTSESLGIGLVLLGVVSIAIAAWRHNQIFRQIERQTYQPNQFLIWLMTAAVMIFGTLSLPLITWRGENSTQSPPTQPKRSP
jgi:putative membrane protein